MLRLIWHLKAKLKHNIKDVIYRVWSATLTASVRDRLKLALSDGTFKRIPHGANPYTGKSMRVMERRKSDMHRHCHEARARVLRWALRHGAAWQV